VSDYNSNSSDAQFATILEKLKNQDKESLAYRNRSEANDARMENLLLIQNGRVRALEREKWIQRGFVAGISLAVTLAWQWLTRK
jgi:hypothetical protein